jgi:hypothetical protein
VCSRRASTRTAPPGAKDRVPAAIEARLSGVRNPLQLVEGGADSCDHPVTTDAVAAPDRAREAL